MKVKIIFKHEIAADWEKSTYIPDVGEQVFYDPDETVDYTRVKYGNGIDMVKDLPFSTISVQSSSVWHEDEILSDILNTYVLNLDYSTIAFDTTEIVIGGDRPVD